MVRETVTLTLFDACLLIACGVLLFLSLWFRNRLNETRNQARRQQEQPPALDPIQHPIFPPPPLFLEVVSSIDIGIVILDTERRMRFLNACVEDLLEVDVQRAHDQRIMTLLRDYQVDELVQKVLSDHEAREMTLQPIASGRTLYLRCSPLRLNGMTEGALLIIRDVTQISMLERARRELVANVSHELRTPLSSLKLLVETLQSSPPPDIMQHMLGQMDQEIEAVTQLVNELHELSQIDSGRVTLQFVSCDIAPIIAHALDRIQPQAVRKQLHIESHVAPDHPPVLMDDHRIGQVLLNLLHNALKFTPDHGSITVRTGVVQVNHHTPSTTHDPDETAHPLHEPETHLPPHHPPGQWMVLSIRDTGIGIPSQEIPRIFERFYKVDRSRTFRGTGLGLAIAKHLVEGHGGCLWVESEEGEGSTFFLTLPLA